MKYKAITFASAAFFVTSLALASDTWVLDSNRSKARLFQGSRATSGPVNVGVACVTGKVKLDANDLDASIFDLSIYPADENWRHVLSPEGASPLGYVPDAIDRTPLAFKSTRILWTGSGQLAVIGTFSLTRLERSVIATPTEANASPAHSDPAIQRETREITLLFPSESAAHFSGPLAPAMPQTKGVLEIVGTARVDREEFPQLLTTIKETSWPLLGKDTNSHMPSTREGYSGAICTGTLNAATHIDNSDMPASIEKDCSGSQCAPSTDDRLTLVLELKFLHKVPETEVEAHSDATSIWNASAVRLIGT